jgi:predicted DCC family thiol-disulfide oxidoreductase YuxK
LAMIAMHLGILLLVDFADLTLGMLMIHAFTFDASWLKPSRTSATKNIVFFDGVCGLCNAFIDFLLKEDRKDVLLFSPLQGETAQHYIKDIDPSNLTTVVFCTDGKIYTKSDAVIEIFKSLGGVWRLAAVFKLIPKPLRDIAYAFVATHRMQWFGQKETCRMPTSKERGKLLA